MLVIHTGSPPPLSDLLDGVVYGVNALFDLLGNGTDKCVVAGAGFAWAALPDPTQKRLPNEREFEAATVVAMKAAEEIRAARTPNCRTSNGNSEPLNS